MNIEIVGALEGLAVYSSVQFHGDSCLIAVALHAISLIIV